MKLLGILVVFALSAPARADEVLHPPGGPVVVEADYRQQAPDRRQKMQQLRRALIASFDANGDGKLGPRERMRAARVLEKIQRKLAGRDGMDKRQRFIRRFDTNRDGNVDPSEMPPGAARKLRRLDRDRDGWLEPNEP